jgi:hypothetical protein
LAPGYRIHIRSGKNDSGKERVFLPRGALDTDLAIYTNNLKAGCRIFGNLF